MNNYLKLACVAFALVIAAAIEFAREQWMKFMLGDDYEGSE